MAIYVSGSTSESEQGHINTSSTVQRRYLGTIHKKNYFKAGIDVKNHFLEFKLYLLVLIPGKLLQKVRLVINLLFQV